MTAIDLSQLPAPEIIEALDYETIIAAMLTELSQQSGQLADGDISISEADPAYKILQVCAYRELLLRQRINDAARSVMVAYAQDNDLEQLAALFGIQRQVIEPGDPQAVPPVAPTYEAIERFRQRIPLSLEAFSTAGPAGAYIFHSLNASADVKDVAVSSPAPGEVLVTLLSRLGNGVPSAELLALVNEHLNHDDIRPLTDNVSVQGATIIEYQVDATLLFNRGPGQTQITQQAQQKVNEYVSEQNKLGFDVTLSGLYAALHQPGVQRVQLNNPTADILVSANSASYCTNVNVVEGGIND